METNELILVDYFCSSCQIDISFIESLHDFQLIEISIVEDKPYLHLEQLKKIEKIHYFHSELNINLEGIEIINNLLQQIEILQQELKAANTKLSILESPKI